MQDHLPILPVVLALAGALLVPIAALVRPSLARPVACAAAGAAALAGAAGLADVVAGGVRRYAVGGWAPPWGIEVVLDPLSAFVVPVLAAVATVTLVTAGPGARTAFRDGAPAFYALALLTLTGLLGMVVSGDLFNVFVFLEVSAIASYALVASGGGRSLIAAFRYLVLGSVGASFYLLGVGLLYGLTGTLNMADLSARLAAGPASPLLEGGVIFVLVGLAIKMGLVPLHQWLPDAYTHAPAPVAAFLAPIGTKAAAYALARCLLYVVPPSHVPVAGALAWAGALAIVAGGILAIRQTDARRLLAYSSLSQLGYIALGFGLANATALAGAYLHILAHAVMKAALFVAVGAAAAAGRGVTVGALGRSMPVTGACAVVAALSMVGVPPLGGFFSKWYLLQGALEARQPLLAAVILTGGLLAAAYMYRLTERLWIGDPGGQAVAVREAPSIVQAGLVLLAAATLAVGLASSALVSHVLLPAASR